MSENQLATKIALILTNPDGPHGGAEELQELLTQQGFGLPERSNICARLVEVAALGDHSFEDWVHHIKLAVETR